MGIASVLEFLEANWFQITLLSSLIIFAVKLAINIKDYMDKSDEKFEEIKNQIKELTEDNNRKFDEIDEKFKEYEAKMIDNQERNQLIIEGIEATLVSLKTAGYNGPVTESLRKIDDYKNRKASQ